MKFLLQNRFLWDFTVLLCISSFVFCIRLDRDETASHNTFQEIVQLAQEESYDKSIIMQMIVNLHETIPKDIRDKLKSNPSDVRKPLSRFLRQYKTEFYSSPPKNKKFCNWFSWLLIKAYLQAESPSSNDDRNAARIQFENELARLCQLYKEGYKEHLGNKYPTFEPYIDEGIDWFTRTSKQKFLLLQQDPLFPVFKEILPKQVFEKASGQILTGETAHYPEYMEPDQIMVLTEERYVKKIESYFTSLPNLWFYTLALDSMIPEMRTDGYLGKGDYSCKGRPQNELWPITIWYQMPKDNLSNESTEIEHMN